MITRNKLFEDFKRTLKMNTSPYYLRLLFKQYSDQDLAEMFNLRVLRKGYFY